MMRLTEIKKINKDIIILSQIKIVFDDEYNQLLLSYKILHKATGLTSDPYLKSKVGEIQSDIEKFINYQFYKDRDIDLLKKQAFEIYKKLDQFS